MSAFFLSQVFAAGTFVLALVAYQCRSQRTTLLLLGLAQVCTSIHFFLLGATVGGFVFGLSALRFLVGVWNKHVMFRYIFILATIIVGVVMFEEVYDVLPIVGGVLGTLAAFTAADRQMRHYLLGGTVTTLLYNSIIFSPVAIFSGLFFLSSSLIGYWRFYLKRQS